MPHSRLTAIYVCLTFLRKIHFVFSTCLVRTVFINDFILHRIRPMRYSSLWRDSLWCLCECVWLDASASECVCASASSAHIEMITCARDCICQMKWVRSQSHWQSSSRGTPFARAHRTHSSPDIRRRHFVSAPNQSIRCSPSNRDRLNYCSAAKKNQIQFLVYSDTQSIPPTLHPDGFDGCSFGSEYLKFFL